jgi:hypothetical protein
MLLQRQSSHQINPPSYYIVLADKKVGYLLSIKFAITMMLSRFRPRAIGSLRQFATQRKREMNPLPQEIIDALPKFPDEFQDPADAAHDDEYLSEPGYQHRKPVTSAHCIDTEKEKVSILDSAAISPNGNIVHGHYGDLGKLDGIPLEYLALLRPAADGAAAVRVTLEKSKHKGPGTILIYGASQASGLAAVQLASSAGHTVVGVVDYQHSGNDDMVECVKFMTNEPGTTVSEEYALSKRAFADLVYSISSGDEMIPNHSASEFVQDFKTLLIENSIEYPDTRAAAVPAEEADWSDNYWGKDREYFKENMGAFLAQFPPGAPPVDEAKFDAFFSPEQYEIFRKRFWKQTEDVLTVESSKFSPPHIVKELMETPGVLNQEIHPGFGDRIPYDFNVLDQIYMKGTEAKPGGPIHGAIIVATPTLKAAATRVVAANTMREKGEALHFLTSAQRGSFGAAASVVALAKKAGAPVVVIGELPDGESVKQTDADVKEALSAMDIDDEGKTKLNYFVQIYRSADYPFYADYAVHRATEPLAGPRQIIVTK